MSRKKNSKDRIICSSCGIEKDAAREYFISYSPFHSHTGRLHICKNCLDKHVDTEDINSIKDALRRLDKPFIKVVYHASLEESRKTGSNLFRLYMKNISMKQYREMTWADSNFENKTQETNEVTQDVEEISESLVKKWGSGYTAADYEYLENFYDDYKNSYATDTPVQINLYKNIAKVHLQAEKELSQGNTKVFKDLMELSSKLHNDGNIKPIQSTGANDDKGLSTYGLWIKTIETEEPCEHFEDKKEYEDFDKFKKYIDNWFVRPFKNIFNISKDFNIKD